MLSTIQCGILDKDFYILTHVTVFILLQSELKPIIVLKYIFCGLFTQYFALISSLDLIWIF